MIDKFRLISWAVLLTIVVLIWCSLRTKRKVLFKGSELYPWRVEYVVEKHFGLGKIQYYQIFYDNKKLVIPKEFLGNEKDIDQFEMAGGFNVNKVPVESVLATLKFYNQDSNCEGSVYVTLVIHRNKQEGTFEFYDFPMGKISQDQEK